MFPRRHQLARLRVCGRPLLSRGIGGIVIGKLSANERKMVEFLERQANDRRKKSRDELSQAVFDRLSASCAGTSLKDVIPRSVQTCQDLFAETHHRAATTGEAEHLLEYGLKTFDPDALLRIQYKQKQVLERCINNLFAEWREETDDNYKTQMGRKIGKSEAALLLGNHLGRLPNQNETDRMWIRKELEIGQAYTALHIPLG